MVEESDAALALDYLHICALLFIRLRVSPDPFDADGGPIAQESILRRQRIVPLDGSDL